MASKPKSFPVSYRLPGDLQHAVRKTADEVNVTHTKLVELVLREYLIERKGAAARIVQEDRDARRASIFK